MKKLFLFTLLLMYSVLLVAQDKPSPVSPFDNVNMFTKTTIQSNGNVIIDGAESLLDAFTTGGNRLVDMQYTDGSWGWPLTAPPTYGNIIGPITMGLAQAYQQTGSLTQRTALLNAGAYLVTKTNNFSPSDGYLAAQLDKIFGGTTYTSYVNTNFYDMLAAGTYDRNGAGTLYSTASYVNLIRTSRSGTQANMAAWDIGMGLVGAAMCGATTTDWIAGVKAEIDELDGLGNYDVIGLAGAVYGLACVNEDFDPTSGWHAAASNLNDLADILASYQIAAGGFAWNQAYVIPNDGNETIQETAYAILALNEINRTFYLTNIQGAANYSMSVQLGTGGWENYATSGENNELTGEALWGISTAYPAPVYNITNDVYYPTIQGAVSDANSGNTITVAAGTYEEQITIDGKALTIQGADVNSTFINSPVTLATTFTTSSAKKCVVGVINDGNLILDGFTVDGLGRGNANYQFVGIGIRNSGGTVQNCKILNIMDTPFSGAQHGVALYSYNDDVTARTINVLNNEIIGFQKNAMALNASDTNPLTVNVDGNTVTGYGATGVTAQNGIQVYGDMINGTIQNNILSGIGYSGTGWVATTILNFYADVNIISNTVTNGHMGIYNIDGNSNILNNNITVQKIGDYGYGIIASDPPQAVPSPFDFTGNSKKIYINGSTGIESVLEVIVSENIVTFSGQINTGTYGIEADAGYGPDDLIFSAVNNIVSGFGVGFGIYKCESGCNTGVFNSIDIHNNDIINNTVALETNVLTPLINAEFNWWGTAIESEIQALIVGTADYDPWIGKGMTVNWSGSMTVNDANSLDGLTNLFFGQNSTATDGIDTHLLEEELPPLPPSGVFDSRFIIPDGNLGSHRDYRSSSKRFVRWVIQFQGTPPFEFTWESSSLPLGDFYLKDPIDGSYVNINMKNQSNYTLPLSSPLNQLVIENSTYNCYPFDVIGGWNLISLPLSPSNPLKSSLFPTSISNAFSYSGTGYIVANELESKKGYWLKFDVDQSVFECGVSSEDFIPVSTGWNMIGVLDEDVLKTQITTVPPNILTGNFFGYQGGYTIANILKVGRGYWIKSNSDGLIKLHNILRKEEEYINPIKSDWASITISNAELKMMDLYFCEDVDTDGFDLPPVPPQGAFDVRFATGKMVETLSEDGVVIHISTTKYPVKIKVSGLDVSVRDLIDGSLLNATILSGDEITILDKRIDKIKIFGNYVNEIPMTYNLEQNFPNPFNPSTSINFSIPKEGMVNLSVFNILGEKVVDLKNEVMEPGYYQLEFNATTLASGVYFYTINVGDFVSSKKMILLK